MLQLGISVNLPCEKDEEVDVSSEESENGEECSGAAGKRDSDELIVGEDEEIGG